MPNNISSPVTTKDKPNLAITPNQPLAEIEQHSLLKSIIMHLFPGILITLFYIIVAPFFVSQGFPPVFTLCLAIPAILIPVELGYLLYKGKTVNGRLSLKGIVLYREHARVWEYLVFGLIILVWSTLSLIIISKPVGGFIAEKFFTWAPDWYVGGNSFDLSPYHSTVS